MNVYFPDEVEITNITYDVTYRTKTEAIPFSSKAFVEEESEIKYGSDGQVIRPEVFMGLPKNTNILKGDFIKVIKLHGQNANIQETERREVKRVSRIGAFEVSHIEALV